MPKYQAFYYTKAASPLRLVAAVALLALSFGLIWLIQMFS